MTPDLIAFLQACIDEDMQLALAASPYTWVFRDIRGVGDRSDASAEHAVRWMPRNAVNDLTAKRQLVDLHQPRDGYKPPDDWYGNQNVCQTCGGYELVAGIGDRGYREPWPCRTLRILALPYDDRPGYDESWRP